MFFRVVVIAASVAAVTASTHAADVYVPGIGGYKDTYLPGPSWWNGFYVGVNGGYGWNADKASVSAYADDATVNLATDLAARSFERSAELGGGQIGFNLERYGAVLGVEVDLQAANFPGSGLTMAAADGGNLLNPSTTITASRAASSLDYFGTIRGRLGYGVDRALFYVTGGFAYGGVKDTLSVTVTNEAAGLTPYGNTVSKDGLRTGYVLGGGVEYALTPVWSLKAEYQYLDLGKVALAEGADLGPTSTGLGAFSADHSYYTFRLGLNYRVQQEYAPLK